MNFGVQRQPADIRAGQTQEVFEQASGEKEGTARSHAPINCPLG